MRLIITADNVTTNMIINTGTDAPRSPAHHPPRPVFVPVLVLICVILISIPFAAPTDYSPSLQRGLSLVKDGNHDSALICFQEAANQGMSRDSMYYLFAQVFLAKGALDTALALNLSAQPGTPGAAVRVALLRQRLHIYHSLSWHSESVKTEDSLNVAQGGPLRYLRPAFRGLIRAGGYRQKYGYGIDNLGVGRAPDNAHELLTTPSGLLSLSSTWTLPSTQLLRPYLGLSGRVDKSAFVRPVRLDGGLWDSTTLAGGMNAGVDLPTANMRLDYSLQRRREALGYLLSVNTVRMIAARSRQKQLFMTEASYSGYLSGIPRLKRHVLALDLTMNQPLAGTLNWTVGAIAVWNIQTPYESDLPFDRFSIKGDTRPVIYYSNNRYADTIPVILSGPASAAYTTTVLATAVADTLHTVIPQQYVSVQPSCMIRMPLGAHSHALLRTSWNLLIFTCDAVWYTLVQPGTYTYNPAKPMRIGRTESGDYRLLDGMEQAGGATALPIVKNSARRVDNTLNAELSFDHDVSTIGQIGISWYASKTWSTLPADAPALVPGWTIGLTCSFALASPI